MTRMKISVPDVKRVCDPRRIVWHDDQDMGRATAFDGTVVIGALAAFVVVALMVIGAPISSLSLVIACFAVMLGVAGRTYLSDVAAGALLRFVQPYEPGEEVHLFRAEQNTYVDARVVRVGPVHTTLAGADREFRVPNHAMISEPSV